MTSEQRVSFAQRSMTIETTAKAPGILVRIRRVWEYRELLDSLTRRELKVKYKNSVLGFLWTLLNPLLYLAVFSLVFGEFLRSSVPRYGLFLLSGLLTWNLFSTGVTGATVSIVGNGPLVQKVWFPREILPLAAIGASMVNFFFQVIVLAVGLIVFGHGPDWRYIWLLIPALGVTVIWAIALGLMFSAMNVYLRDVQHFLELLFLAWFWLTPVVYQYDFIGSKLIERFGAGGERLMLFNPIMPIVVAFQRAIYNPEQEGADYDVFNLMLSHDASWHAINLAIVGVAGLVMLWFSFVIFGRLEANLGEEL